MLQPAPIYKSLTTPLQVQGAERDYAILVIGATALLGVLGWYFRSIPCAVVAVLVYSGGMLFLRRIAKNDPHGVEIARRFYSYKRFYPARTAPQPAGVGRGRAALTVMAGLLSGLLAWLLGSLLAALFAAFLLAIGVILMRKAAN